MASNVQQRPTPLTGTKGNFTFEIWVEIEGRPLEIYGETRGEDGVLEAWIPSEEGKFYSVCVRMKNSKTSLFSKRYVGIPQYPDMQANCVVDGLSVKKVSYFGHKLHSADGAMSKISDLRISDAEVQKLMFSKPVLIEEETPGIDMKRLATIEVCFRRCRRERDANPASYDEGKRSTIRVNETSKKANLLSAVTAFGQPEVAAKRRSYCPKWDPQDHEGYFKLRFRYAPRDFLQALGHVPLVVNVQPGEAGLKKYHPIALDDDDQPQAGPSVSRRQRGLVGEDVKVKPEGLAPADNEAAVIARQIAEARAELQALEERQRSAMGMTAGQRRSQPNDEEDNKENIPRGMAKRLKVAKEEDGGIVDLTFDDD